MTHRQRRDYVVVFGAAVRKGGVPSPVLARRISGACNAWHRDRSSIVVATGGVARHAPAEAIVIRDGLLAGGVEPTAILTDTTSRDTLQSVRACAAILRARGDHERVLVCTSGFHAPRCRLLLRIAGLRTGVVAVPPSPDPTNLSRLLWIAKELLVTPYDALLALVLRLTGRLPARPGSHSHHVAHAAAGRQGCERGRDGDPPDGARSPVAHE